MICFDLLLLYLRPSFVSPFASLSWRPRPCCDPCWPRTWLTSVRSQEIGEWRSAGAIFPGLFSVDGSKHGSVSQRQKRTQHEHVMWQEHHRPFSFRRVASSLPVETEIQGKQMFCRIWRKDGASSESNSRRADACQTLLVGGLGHRCQHTGFQRF